MFLYQRCPVWVLEGHTLSSWLYSKSKDLSKDPLHFDVAFLTASWVDAWESWSYLLFYYWPAGNTGQSHTLPFLCLCFAICYMSLCYALMGTNLLSPDKLLGRTGTQALTMVLFCFCLLMNCLAIWVQRDWGVSTYQSSDGDTFCGLSNVNTLFWFSLPVKWD